MFFFFYSEKVWAGWWHDSPGILKMHISLKMHIFIGFCPTSGLFWESGGMAGWQQAPAGNHRHGHLGRAGKNENFCSSSIISSPLFSLVELKCFCLPAVLTCTRPWTCIYLMHPSGQESIESIWKGEVKRLHITIKWTGRICLCATLAMLFNGNHA